MVACLLPIDHPKKKEDWRKVWAEMDELTEEIGKHLLEGVSAVEAAREQRRGLTSDEWVKPEQMFGGGQS